MYIPRIIIADDHHIVMDGLSKKFSDRGFDVVGTATSYRTLLHELSVTDANMIILDLNGLGVSSLSMVIQLRLLYPNVRIIVFSSSHEFAPDLIERGIAGYVTKEDPAEHLILAVECSLRGEIFLSDTVRLYVSAVDRPATDLLTPREREVLVYLSEGKRTEHIADLLCVATSTVQSYVSSMFYKTRCTNRLQLVAWWNTQRKNLSAQVVKPLGKVDNL